MGFMIGRVPDLEIGRPPWLLTQRPMNMLR